jgi:23S rRNA G2445 N2-methylase RlmL
MTQARRGPVGRRPGSAKPATRRTVGARRTASESDRAQRAGRGGPAVRTARPADAASGYRRGEATRRRFAEPETSTAAPRYLVHTVPGLEEVTQDEVAELIPEAKLVGAWRRFDERTSLLEFRADGGPRPWLKLATTEDVFALAARGRALRPGEVGLADLSAAVLTSRRLDRAMRTLANLRKGVPESFRVVARMAGEHGFRRVDAQRTVESALRKRFPRMRRVDDAPADAELWLSLVGDEALVGVRLSTERMRGTRKEIRSLPASLKASVARAMVRLSEPAAADVVLDPMCGAGTLLIERALAGPYAELLGGDRDSSAVMRARGNVRAAGLSAPIKEWDARNLPLDDASVDAILTNPPFGKQVELPGEPEPFYRDLVGELTRVLKPRGRLVLVTGQFDAFQAAAKTAGLKTRRRLGVVLRGERATIFVCEKPGGG